MLLKITFLRSLSFKSVERVAKISNLEVEVLVNTEEGEYRREKIIKALAEK